MLDGTEFFECDCGADEHTLRFTLDLPEREIYISMFLQADYRWYKRTWIAIKYIFGYKCKYGHWDNWTIHKGDAKRLRDMLNKFVMYK